MKVNRANLKAGNILLLVAWLMLPPNQTHRFGNDVFVELAFYEEGAQLPRALVNNMTLDIKMELGYRLSEAQDTGDHIASILRVVGLDHVFLCDVPAYRHLYTMRSNHLQTLFAAAPLLAPLWVSEQGPARRLEEHSATDKILASLMAFFDEHRHVIHTLQEIMGHNRVAAAFESLDAEHSELARQMAHYSNSFAARLLKPCPACGLPTPGPYSCPCRCPAVAPPVPFDQGGTVQPRVETTPVKSFTSRRRGKNLQTAFVLPAATHCHKKQTSTGPGSA